MYNFIDFGNFYPKKCEKTDFYAYFSTYFIRYLACANRCAQIGAPKNEVSNCFLRYEDSNFVEFGLWAPRWNAALQFDYTSVFISEIMFSVKQVQYGRAIHQNLGNGSLITILKRKHQKIMGGFF